ncbi:MULTISPECIES: hypothetical protein [Microcoleaceae]|nr:hypothetical protein [Tychonema sp. LEGE 06208]MBE9165719.1 hypothetical protein [Tychonema sp. LEGE 06208]
MPSPLIVLLFFDIQFKSLNSLLPLPQAELPPAIHRLGDGSLWDADRY